MNSGQGIPRPRRRRWLNVLGLYVILLLISHIVQYAIGRAARPLPGQQTASVHAVKDGKLLNRPVQVAYSDLRPSGPAGTNAPTVLLIHGSPSKSFDLSELAGALAGTCRVITPDLPGFGRSARWVPDYSMQAHGIYLLQFLNALHIEQVHVVAYSQGGGAALVMAHRAPGRVKSLTLVSSIGVQEFELLGNYHLNHALHGLQLVGLWLVHEGLPHMGLLDDAMLNVTYARNFYDSDQRPFRGYLMQYEGPVHIVHGTDDPLVPLSAALEHQRIVPQSDLTLMDGGHILVYQYPEELADVIFPFIEKVDQGFATTRKTAEPDRVTAAGQPYDAGQARKAMGIALAIMVVLVAAATLVSEDLACIGAGLMVARGVIGYFPAAFAAFIGIFFGDLLLFLAGQYIGRPLLKHRPFKWFVSEADIEESAKWFSRKGAAVVLLSRFVPGSRLPTYFTAGLLHRGFWKFFLFFLLAGMVWAPLLVWLSMMLGGRVLDYLETYRFYTVVTIAVTALLLWLIIELVIPMFSFRGRRLLLSAWRRKTRWEFWPLWFFYPPILLYVAYLAIRYRGATVFTAANPAIPAGGFLGESKSSILRGLKAAGGNLARFTLVPASLDAAAKVDMVRAFLANESLGLPVVLKPDVGQRGLGVAVIRTEEELAAYFAKDRPDTLAQEYVPGYEFGVFYYRHPDQERGRIYSITEKRFPVVVADGTSDLEHLILKDDRAVCMAHFFLRKHQDRLYEVPPEGEEIPLVELGTHCRGAMFLDGRWVRTPALVDTIDRISKSFPGFYFGRYDVRTPSIEDLKLGRGFKIIELNGVTSEATHIYSPGASLLAGYRTLMIQWRIAFEIGAKNRARGVKTTPVRQMLVLLLQYNPAPEAG